MKTFFAVAATPLHMTTTETTRHFVGFKFFVGEPAEASSHLIQRKVNGYDLMRHFNAAKTLYVFETEEAAASFADKFFTVEDKLITRANPVFNINMDDSFELSPKTLSAKVNAETIHIVATAIKPSDTTLGAALLIHGNDFLAQYLPTKWFETNYSGYSFVPDEYESRSSIMPGMTP